MAPESFSSWNDTPTKEAIVDFAENAAKAVPPEERIAVFDNDGTLWCERPMPVELGFLLERFAEMARGMRRSGRGSRGRQPASRTTRVSAA